MSSKIKKVIINGLVGIVIGTNSIGCKNELHLISSQELEEAKKMLEDKTVLNTEILENDKTYFIDLDRDGKKERIIDKLDNGTLYLSSLEGFKEVHHLYINHERIRHFNSAKIKKDEERYLIYLIAPLLKTPKILGYEETYQAYYWDGKTLVDNSLIMRGFKKLLKLREEVFSNKDEF